jgi:hypothetical protein
MDNNNDLRNIESSLEVVWRAADGRRRPRGGAHFT